MKAENTAEEEEKNMQNPTCLCHDSGDGYVTEMVEFRNCLDVFPVTCILINIHIWPVSFLLAHPSSNTNNQVIVKYAWLGPDPFLPVEWPTLVCYVIIL